MPAMHPLVVTAAKQAVHTMLWRHLQLNEFTMTHDECLRLVAPPEHFEVLKTASQYVDVEASEGNIFVEIPRTVDGVDMPKVTLRMRTHEGIEPPLRPRTPVWHSSDPETCDKVITWAQHRLHHGRMAAATTWVLEQLAERCDRGEQMRYLWPSVMLLVDLCRDDSETKWKVGAWKSKFGIYKAVKNTPSINPVLRKAIVDCSQWLTQGLMLAEVPQAKPGFVTCAMARTYQFWLGHETEDAVILERD